MSKTLIEEALEDAKQVRDTALANAKLALEEAFEPRIKNMIAKSLQAEAEAVEDEEEVSEVTDEEGNLKDPTNAKTAKINTEDADPELEESSDEDEDDDLDLEAVLAELEAELGEAEDEEMDDEIEEAEDEESHEDDEIEEAEDDIDLEKLLDLDEDEDEEMDDELEEGDDEEESHDEEEIEEGDDESDDDEEIDLEELLGLSESDDDEDEDLEENLAAENKRLASELQEHREAIESLRNQLNEVNLLNAKLLYTTKLFKKYSLDNSQKMKVVESFDRTKTVREAKLIYATLSESLGSTGVSKKKSKRRANNSLTEGMASSVVKSTKPQKNIISESNDITDRFKKLISYNK